MKLKEYVDKYEIVIVKMAKELDVSRAHLSRITHGRRYPAPRLAKAIEKYTHGQVTIKELMKDNED